MDNLKQDIELSSETMPLVQLTDAELDQVGGGFLGTNLAGK